jgi:2,3-dihydroxybenzoate decarboxylase
MRLIALEEAFSAPGMEPYLDAPLGHIAPREATIVRERLADFDRRIDIMDEAGVDICVLSETSPGVQVETDTATAVARARSSNDYLHAQIARHPDRYRGFAHLAMQDVATACAELERCVRNLGFVGALINGQTLGVYLDDARYLPFWDKVATLAVPVYLHPADPFGQPHVLSGWPVIQGSVWGWTFETSSHFLRLLFAGLFDRYPALRIILGHMGETLPFEVWRIDRRYSTTPAGPAHALKRAPSEYLRDNLVITTSGVCQDSALACSLAELGDDNVLFAMDYPYEDAPGATRWIGAAPIGDATREKVCFKNAELILRL